jgi:hypothetical protein
MAHSKWLLFLTGLLCFLWNTGNTQIKADSIQQVMTIPARNLDKLGQEYAKMARAIQKQSARIWDQLQQEDARLQQKLLGRDSAAGQLFIRNAGGVYTQLQNQLHAAASTAGNRVLTDYIPGIDSVQTAIQFLTNNKLTATLPGQLQSLQSLNGQLNGLTNQLQLAGKIQTLAAQRQQEWLTAIQSYGPLKGMSGMQQKIFYYKTSIQQYKDMLHDPDKLAGKILAAVRNNPAFAQFMQNNSYLSSLFRLPGSSSSGSGMGLAGLQTRDQVNALVKERLGAGPSFVAAAGDQGGSGNPLAAGMQEALAQLNQWKSKVSQFGIGNSNASVPDFQPNSQHNKSFFHRLDIGFNIQSTSSSLLIPAYSDIALTIGYKVNDRFVTGIGVSYKIGWGQPFTHVNISGLGAGLRSYINWRIKNSWWLSGGLEGNYLNAFTRLAQLHDLNAWQKAGLMGIMKTYKAGKRQGNIQFLYDLLHADHIPQSPAFIFRAGYSIN